MSTRLITIATVVLFVAFVATLVFTTDPEPATTRAMEGK